MTPQEIIAKWRAICLGDPQRLQDVDAVFKFVVSGSKGGTWIVRCRSPVSIIEGEGEADCSFELSADDFVGVIEGRVNPQQAFLEGKIT
ncbi:MAG: hypothetical protein DCC75_13140, partial [Proteobacteria bacterium]